MPGGQVVGEEFVPVGEDDHEAHLARIRAARPDVVLISLIGADSITFKFANLSQKVQDVVAFDSPQISKGLGMEVSGFIGAPTLHQLTVSIDYRDNLVHFAYDPKRIRRCVDGLNIADCY